MSIAKIKDGKIEKHPVSSYEIRKEFPNTSFPKNINAADLTSFGYVSVLEIAPPSFDPLTEKVEQAPPVLVSGVWVQQYEKIELAKEESDRRKAEAAESKASAQRGQRNDLLSETDYLALSDATLTDEMRTYRQALRDVPAQSGFPDNITWPTKP